jgi:two-component system, sensor histidine kinase and response regulator
MAVRRFPKKFVKLIANREEYKARMKQPRHSVKASRDTHLSLSKSVQSIPSLGQILLADDSLDSRFLLEMMLTKAGYKVTCASSGLEALAQIEKNCFDLVLLDAIMPDLDGYEVTVQVRQNQKLSFVPIVLITDCDTPNLVYRLDCGADDFICKPIKRKYLLAKVRALLRLKYAIAQQAQIALQREDFVRQLTHDLRNPLLAAHEVLNSLYQGNYGCSLDDFESVIARLIRNNQNLLDLVNTLLAVYEYEAAKKPLSFLRLDLAQLIAEVIEEFNPLAVAKGLTIDREQHLTPVWVMGDRLQLRRVFVNLISNAIKFTDSGSICVSCCLSDSSQFVEVLVQDTGIGIDQEYLSDLFQPFQRVNHNCLGTGLGLYLAKQIVEAHQGYIEVKSELGKGCFIKVVLPSGVSSH